MRFFVYGAGGVGGTIGARLHMAGFDVTLIARGAHFEAIAKDGLRFCSPTLDVVLDIPCIPHPAAAPITLDDAVLLCMKGQHTEAALRDLHAATGGEARVVCCQNGVENERLALRRFAHVYGMVVWLPAEHLQPGVVVGFAEDAAGALHAGCYPTGTDEFIAEVVAALANAGFSTATHRAIMGHKYQKLLSNLNNAIQAATGTNFDGFGDEQETAATLRNIACLLREEALACYRAAGIHCATREEAQAIRSPMRGGDVPGHARHGGSSLQSIMRGTGDIETDCLNGEIVLLGRLHGVPTPVNAAVQALGNRLVNENMAPGSMTIEELSLLVENGKAR